ncbi:MAG TPA: outer membrane beta-barrel protein [Xanthobacteraceae bacterium]|jgi:outer membrane immunogenic protein|nr:outer membrane beta-barrel protein [Xanthobacteraceae bacterium]
MKKLVLVGCALGALAVPAMAADMRVKAPILKAPPPVFSWTGCYLGGNGGWKWGRFGETVDTTGGTAIIPGLATTPFAAGHISFDGVRTDSGAAGGQIGCRWESADHWVLGGEGDFDWTNLHATAVVTQPAAVAPFPFTTGDSFGNHARWESSARIVVGHTWDRVFLYATGGVAFSRVTMDANFVAVTFGGVPFPASAGSDSRTLVGGTIGAGGAYALDQSWSIGAEYRFTAYQKDDFGLGSVAAVCGFPTFPAGAGVQCANAAVTGHKDLQTHEILFKLNYQLGGPFFGKL